MTNTDPAALQALARTTRQNYMQRNQPCPYQRSELSDLQKLVKEAKRTIIDPVLAQFACLSDPDSESELERVLKPRPEEIRREKEREKLRELKKRRICGGLKLPSRARGPSGVFIRRDIDDESVHVDVDADVSLDGDVDSNGLLPAPLAMDVESSIASTSRSPSSPRHTSRVRRPSTKLQTQSNGTSLPSRRKSGAAELPQLSLPPPKRSKIETQKDPPDPEPPPPLPAVKRDKDAKGKPRSETYKLAWSVSEQHLLEQLLEQIPDGEKNRWQKISRAMEGRRTPRQVASRVQKYFEKLKRFGVGEA